MQQITSVGLTGDRKNSARAQKRFFSPRHLKNSMIGESNQVKISPNFVGMITRDLWTCPRKESTNHFMVREESRNSRAKTRFSQKRKNVNSRELVNPSDLGLIEAVWIHHKELEKPPKSRAPKLVKSKRKSSHERSTTHEFDARSKPRRAQGG